MNEPGYQFTVRDPTAMQVALTDLYELKNGLIQDKDTISQKLEKIDCAILAISEVIETLPSGFPQATQPASATHTDTGTGQVECYESWEEYRNSGYDIPEECPVSPGELRQGIAEHQIPEGLRTTRVWKIKKCRNLSALRLMADRVPEGKFLLLDFARIMCAVGLSYGPPKHCKTTLERHMGSVPDDWNNLGNGYWQLINGPSRELITDRAGATCAQTFTESAETVATADHNSEIGAQA